jgi:hypothetical protein
MSAIATRKDAVSVFLRKGDSLVYELTVQSSKANFILNDTTDANNPIDLMSDTDKPAQTLPDVVYQRKWPLSGDDINPRDRDHVLAITHFKGDKYTYKITHNQNGQDTVIVDIDYAGKDGELDQKFFNVQLSKQFKK